METAIYLDSNHVNYQRLNHDPTATARELANVVHLPGEMICKTVVIFADQLPIMLVLPAARRIDFALVSEILQTDDIRLASEGELACLFPDCELGSIPPFGLQYDMRTIVDKSLQKKGEVVFSGNSHGEAYRVNWQDFLRVENPEVSQFTR